MQDCEGLEEDQKIKVLLLLKWVVLWEGRQTLCILKQNKSFSLEKIIKETSGRKLFLFVKEFHKDIRVSYFSLESLFTNER